MELLLVWLNVALQYCTVQAHAATSQLLIECQQHVIRRLSVFLYATLYIALKIIL